MTRSELKARIRRAELTAVLLRQGAHLGTPQREQIAEDLEDLARIARRVVYAVAERAADAMAEPGGITLAALRGRYDQTADDDATEADLMGGAA